jgi:hypothetical protein
LEVRVELSFYRRLVISAWLAEEILGVAKDLVTGKQIVESILGCPEDPIMKYNPRIFLMIQQWIRSLEESRIQ